MAYYIMSSNYRIVILITRMPITTYSVFWCFKLFFVKPAVTYVFRNVCCNKTNYCMLERTRVRVHA